MKKILISLLWLLFPAAVYAGTFTEGTFQRETVADRLRTSTVASLPSAPATGTVRLVTNGSTTSDCTVGGGTGRVLCEYDGANWGARGGASGGAQLDANGQLLASYLPEEWMESQATVPGAGASKSATHIWFADDVDEVYFGFAAGGNMRSITDMAHAWTQMTGTDSASRTCASANCTMALAGTNMTAVLTGTDPNYTLTLALSNHVKSIYFPAGALSSDGTQCANPAEVTINSGPRTWSIICTDNDASTIYGHVVMPDSWNAGTVTFEAEYVQTAADTNVLNSDIAAMCRGAGETINNTWGTEVAIDDAAVSGSNIVDHTTSGAVTANGTCAAGDTLFFRWQLDATGTTTAVATLHMLGFKMEYTVIRGGSD